jgi:hypothetical protein
MTGLSKLVVALGALVSGFGSFAVLIAVGDERPALFRIREEFELPTPGAAMAVAWSPDGSTLAAVSNYGGVITVWNKSGQRLNSFIRKGPAASDSLAFFDGSSSLLYNAEQGSAKDIALEAWNVKTGEISGSIKGVYGVQDFCISRDRDFLAISSYGSQNNLTIYVDRKGQSPFVYSQTVSGGVFSIALDETTSTISVGSYSGLIHFIDQFTGIEKSSFYAYRNTERMSVTINSISYDKNGLFFAASPSVLVHEINSPDSDVSRPSRTVEPIRVFRSKDYELVASVPLQSVPLAHKIRWSPSEEYLAFIAGDGGLYLWKPLMDQPPLPQRVGLSGNAISFAFSPDGKLLAVTTSAGVSVISITEKHE